ncbi:thioredoxin [Methanothrix sp.]|jgi:thioredoxin 1|uniref:thioredoxin n=1 Tax=Methanothrix sp. TaxID=90426 RepID=UPI00247D994B|nr:thioredoxin [Methanothrix sp.]MDH7597744.1 thioredoxin [Methanothrix sp.]HOK58086.1 thioredoxin [Methanothrix sp.]HOL42990.1 thioredoxin [Methanothrix sp.]HPO87993.1 thioredoxin [Methanothrix sp.]
MDELDEIRRKKLEELKRELAARSQGMPTIEYPDRPVLVTDSSIDAGIKQYPVFVVDCWAEWCGPCRAIAPVIDEMARELKGHVVFGKLNVDQNPLTSRKYGITAIPTLLVFRNGRLVDRLVGAYPKQILMSRIKKHLD